MKKYTPYFIAVLFSFSTQASFAQITEEDESTNALSLMSTQVPTGGYKQAVQDLVTHSSCLRYNWKTRGRAPAGYIKGVALGFARSLCRAKATAPSGLAKILSAAQNNNPKKDALAHYRSTFESLRIPVTIPGEEAIRSVYTLGMGLGMRESSGTYCEGWDQSAGSNRPSAAAEAGAFQVSYDSMASSPELKKLYTEYQATPGRCLLSVFKEGASCRSQSILGTGAGAVFQAFNKSCPAFATEYAMTMLRVQRSHFGPINRKDAEVIPVCNTLLRDVQDLVDADPQGVCQELQ